MIFAGALELETHYIASFLPVFYWECRAQLQRSKPFGQEGGPFHEGRC